MFLSFLLHGKKFKGKRVKRQAALPLEKWESEKAEGLSGIIYPWAEYVRAQIGRTCSQVTFGAWDRNFRMKAW